MKSQPGPSAAPRAEQHERPKPAEVRKSVELSPHSAKIIGFLRGECPRGGGNWGTLRIPREDWGTLGKIRESPPRVKNSIRRWSTFRIFEEYIFNNIP